MKRVLGLLVLLLCLSAPATASAADTDFSVTVTDRDPVALGNQLRYAVAVKNLGPATDDAVVTATVPAGTTFESAAPSKGTCTQPDATTIRCALGTFATNATASVVVFLTPQATGQVSFTAQVAGTGADPNTGNNTDTETTTVTARQNRLSVAVSDSPDPAAVGQTITYTAAVTNTDTVTVTDVTVTWTAPDGTTSTVFLGDIAASQSAQATLTVQATGVGTYNATASASSPMLATAATGSASTKVAGPPTDIALSITDTPDPALENGTITYTFTVANQGGNAADQVALTATLPSGMVLEQATDCASAGQVVSCDLGSLAAGASRAIAIKAKAPAAGQYTVKGSVDSAATETLEQRGNNAAEAATAVVIRESDLSLSIVDPGPVLINDRFGLQFVVSNPSVAPAESVRVEITLPANVTLVKTTTRAACSPIGAVLSCIFQSISGGGSPAILLTLKAPGSARALAWSATVTSPTKDPNADNNKASATVNVVNELPTTPTAPTGPGNPTDPTTPRLQLTAGLAAKTAKPAKGVKVAVVASRRASVRLALAVKQRGGALTLARKTVSGVTGERTLTLKLSKTARRAISRLKAGSKLILSVKATPESGRAVTRKLTLRVAKGGRLKAA